MDCRQGQIAGLIIDAFQNDDERNTGIISVWRLKEICRYLGHDDETIGCVLNLFRNTCGNSAGGIDYREFVMWMLGEDGSQQPVMPSERTTAALRRRTWDRIAATDFSKATLAQVALEAKAVTQELGEQGLSSPTRNHGISRDEISMSFLRFSCALLLYCLCTAEPGQNGINLPIVLPFRVALLLIDVSGFTRMTVKLGAELTRKHTSTFFDRIIHCITHHGGDVLKFLGDALLVAWPAAVTACYEEQRSIVVAAAACASEVMRTLNDYRITDEISLTLHGGLAVGNVYAFDVGNSQRREFLIGGSVLSEIGDMEAEAESGQLVMSQEIASMLPNSATLMRLQSGGFLLNLESMVNYEGIVKTMISEQLALQFAVDTGKYGSEDDEEEVSQVMHCAWRFETYTEAHVPPSCREYVRHGALRNLGEMRHVTTLFLSLDMLVPHLNDGEVSLVQTAFLVIIEAVKFAGGIVRQFVLDDKGCVAILAWGLPRAAHGSSQDAVRAIQCAFHIFHGLHDPLMFHGALEEMKSGPRIGIAAGEVYVGLIGAVKRCEYAMVGPSVNLSARLMGKAKPWQVLLEETVHDNSLKSQSSFNFIAQPPVQAKGYDHKVPVFVLEEDGGKDKSLACNHDFLEEFTELWGGLELRVQLVCKVTSVLAEGPDGDLVDFHFRSLVNIVGKLGIATYAQTKQAMKLLQATGFFRLRWGARRGNPSYAFTVDSVQKWVLTLLTVEYSAEIRELLQQWHERRADLKDMEDQMQATLSSLPSPMPSLSSLPRSFVN